MNATLTRRKVSVFSNCMSAIVGLALGLGAGAAPAAVSTTGNNFTMLDPGNGITGGTNDVVFKWDETYRYNVAVSGNVSNATITSVTPFFAVPWFAHDVTIYGPGTYTFDTDCPPGEPGCVGSTVSYKPKPNFNGSDSFSYTIVDARGGAATATVNVTVTPVNDAPVANKDLIVTSQDAGPVAINPLLNDTDVEGDALTVSAVTQPTNGSVSFTANSVSYTPNAGFFGIDSFTYTASDGNGGATVGTVYAGVNQTGNIPPAVPANAVISANEDVGGSTTPPGIPTVYPPSLTIVFANNGAKCIGAFSNVTQFCFGTSCSTQPASVGCNLSNANARDFNGADSFTYVITDGKGGITIATANVTVNPVNDAPVAVADALITNQDAAMVTINPLLNDTDVENSALTVAAITQPAYGTASFTASSVSYTPNAGFFGIDSFTYTANDGALNSAPTKVTVAVNATGNTPPVAVSDNLVVAEDGTNKVYAIKNDSDPDGDKLKVIMAVGPATNGTPSFKIGKDLTITVGPGQVGGHMLFDWNGNLNIDLVNVWTMKSMFGTGTQMYSGPATTADSWSGVKTTIWDGASSDIDANGIPGIGFVDGPFVGFSGSFNLMGLHKVPIPGDLDFDGDVDSIDLNIVLAARNTPATGPNDLRDLDGDGWITLLDARKLTTLCTRPRCATQ
jgi:hypothetical protein